MDLGDVGVLDAQPPRFGGAVGVEEEESLCNHGEIHAERLVFLVVWWGGSYSRDSSVAPWAADRTYSSRTALHQHDGRIGRP